MRNNREYQICKALAEHMRVQYPNLLWHWDLAGLNLSRAQAGMMKAIQGRRGFPDLQILTPKGKYHGLMIEIKKEGTKIFNKKDCAKTEHLLEQWQMIQALNDRGYYATFGIGFDECKRIIDEYLNL